MITVLNAPVSVTLQYNHHLRQSRPTTVHWEGKDYPIIQMGYHHTYREGHTLIHIYSVASKTMFFRLKLNTQTLQWNLEGISDAEVN